MRPNAAKNWTASNKQKAFEAIKGHASNPAKADFTVVDVTGFTQPQIAEISDFIKTLTAEEQGRIIGIGF